MCIFQHQGRTSSKTLSLYRPYSVAWKCGHCHECVKEQRNEWLLRSYFESKDTLDRGGYVLFDTLTHDNEHLHHISEYFPELDFDGMNIKDFSCFDYTDVRKFTNNLWTAIHRLPHMEDYDVKENVKFFLVPEYGHEEPYQDWRGRWRVGTMRPHYHILFYVKDKRLHPGTLIRLIYHIWRRGDTDNHRNGMMYAKQKNIIGRGYTKSTTKNILAVSNYVSKYITKQADYMDKLEARINAVVELLTRQEWQRVFSQPMDSTAHGVVERRLYWQKRKDVERYCSPFHRQSRGFGACALSDEKVYNDIVENMRVVIPDSRFHTKRYNVPKYYMRKLFYKNVVVEERIPVGLQIVAENGRIRRKPVFETIRRYRWVLNDFGKEKYPAIQEARCRANRRRFNDMVLNMDTNACDIVASLLDGRDLQDLSEYVTYYRGRLYDRESVLPTIEQMNEYDINYSPYEDTGLYNNGCSVVRTVHSAVDEELQCIFGDVVDEQLEESYRGFERYMVINEQSDIRFRDFDKLLLLLHSSRDTSDKGKQAYFELVEDLAKRLKG